MVHTSETKLPEGLVHRVFVATVVVVSVVAVAWGLGQVAQVLLAILTGVLLAILLIHLSKLLSHYTGLGSAYLSCPYFIEQQHPIVAHGWFSRWIELPIPLTWELTQEVRGTGPWIEPVRTDGSAQKPVQVDLEAPAIGRVDHGVAVAPSGPEVIDTFAWIASQERLVGNPAEERA